MIAFSETTPAHLEELVANMRAADRLEQIRLGISVEEAVGITWRRTLLAKTLIVRGQVAACFGVAGSPMGGVGQPWMLTTAACEQSPFLMVRGAIEEVQSWLEIFARLENDVDAAYTKACRFVGIIGFTLDAPRRVGAGDFRRFWMER